MNMSDTELLISNIKNCRFLWDVRHKSYHNRFLVDKEWNRIAEDLKIPKETIKSKWKNLRDKFKKELNKIPKQCSGDDGENAPIYNGSWCHFKSLTFLRFVVSPRPTEENLQGPQNSQELEQSDDDDEVRSPELMSEESTDYANVNQHQTEIDLDNGADTINSLPDVSEQKTVNRKRKTIKKIEENIDDQFLRLKARKVALLEKNEEDDEDINFFKSLLPHVRLLPPIKKLRFRSQVQNLLAAALENLQDKQHSPSSTNYNQLLNFSKRNASSASSTAHNNASFQHTIPNASPASSRSSWDSGAMSPIEPSDFPDFNADYQLTPYSKTTTSKGPTCLSAFISPPHAPASDEQCNRIIYGDSHNT